MFYDNFVRLCELKNVSPSRAAQDCGIAKSVVSNWKAKAAAGIELIPSGTKLKDIAAYFGVSTDYLLGKEEECFMFYDIYKQLCDQKGVSPSRAAADCGVNSSNVSLWKKHGYTPRAEVLNRLAAYFGVSTDYLLGKEKDPPKTERVDINVAPGEIPYASSRYAPILGTIPAGLPCLALEDIQGYAAIPYKDDGEDYFYLRVTGESMRGAGIQPGDLVLIRRQPCAEDGQIVACRVNGDESTLKRYKRQGGMVMLLPENPDFEPRLVPLSDFESGAAEIIGVALEIRRTL